MNKIKVLIVGGAGYIGGGITDCFNEFNVDCEEYYKPFFDFTVFDNLTYETRFLKQVKFIYGDVRDTELLKTIIPKFDIIIWLAAIVGDGACQINVNLTNTINYESVKWLVDNFGDKKIIFTSTCSVYGINHNLIDEEATPNPLSLYAETKLLAEQYIVKNCKDYLIFRLGTLFGLSDTYSRIRFDLVVNILSLKATRGETLQVFGGEQWRPLLHVNDVANAIYFGLTNNIKGLYNLSSSNARISDITTEIKKVIPTCITEETDLKFEDLRNYKVKNDKFLSIKSLKEGWSWLPNYTLSNGIEEIVNLVRDNRVVNPYDPIYSNVAHIGAMYK